MAHQVLARKWRPRRFEDVVGQDHVVRALANALDTDRIHHAYLFTGTRGVGKTTLARILAKALNCIGEDGKGKITSHPCGVCRACTDIDAGRFVDLLEVDAATNTKVDEMRELLETAQYAPVSGRYKVYIIDEVHMLSKNSFNAMLKTLEEPPGHVQFILATTDPQKLPITVLSRCLQFNLKNLAPNLLAQHLAMVLKAEKIGFEPEALQMLGRAGEGSARDALSLLDQAIAYGAGEINTEHVATMLGVLDQTYLFSMLAHLGQGDAKALLAEIDRVAERSISFDLTLKDLASVLARVALVQTAGAGVAGGPDASKILALAETLSTDDVQLFYQIALLGRRDLALAPDEQSGFTMTLLRMLAFKQSASGQTAVGQTAMGQSAKSQSTNGQSAESPVSTPVSAPMPPDAATTKAKRDKALETPAVTRPSADSLMEQSGAQGFGGDWPQWVAQQNFSGVAGILARQCEFRSFEAGILHLAVPGAQKHVADKSYQEKLRAELVGHFGESLRLKISVVDVAAASMAARDDINRSSAQSAAEASIDQDPFIKNLRADFGAEVNRASIRPATSQE